MNGGGGDGDTVTYAGRTDNITFSFVSGAVNGGSQDGAEGARDTVTSAEGVIGGDGDDDLSAGAATVPVRLEGGPGGRQAARRTAWRERSSATPATTS